MRYKVYAGEVSVTFSGSILKPSARFNWTEKALVFDSCGDAVEGEEAEGILADPVVNLENKEAGSFTCLVPYSVETRTGAVKNSYYEKFKMGKTFIMVEEDDECIFFGRVTECELGFNLEKNITADGILSDLDRVQMKLSSGPLKSNNLLDVLMKPSQNFKGDSPVNCMVKGNVTVENKTVVEEETGDQIGSYWGFMTNYLLDNDKLSDGYLKLRLSKDPGTEDYFFYYDFLLAEDVPKTTQSIEYGVNMLDMTYEEKLSSEMVNSVTAHGVETVKKGWWIFKTTSYESISSTWKDAESIKKYGLSSKHIYVDGKKSTEDSLYEAAQEEAKNYKSAPEPTLTVKAFDRRDTGENVDKLGYMRYTHIYSKPHNIDRWMVCTGVKLPLDAPDNKEFTFGQTFKSTTSLFKKLYEMTRNLHTAVAGLISNANS